MFDSQLGVRNHVYQNHRLHAGEFAARREFCDKMPAAIETVTLRPLPNRLLAIEKDQPVSQLTLLLRQNPGHLQQKGGARTAVIRTHKSKLAKALGIVVP